jgi:hypothetical protein
MNVPKEFARIGWKARAKNQFVWPQEGWLVFRVPAPGGIKWTANEIAVIRRTGRLVSRNHARHDSAEEAMCSVVCLLHNRPLKIVDLDPKED